MGSKLSGHQLNIDCYIQMSYTSWIVTTNQKPVINMQTLKRKEPKYVTKKSQLIMREEREKKKGTK